MSTEKFKYTNKTNTNEHIIGDINRASKFFDDKLKNSNNNM